MNLQIKKLIYKSIHRGCKEIDILIGKFADSNLQDFNDNDLELYSKFIEEDDLEIYEWLLRKKLSPKKYQDLINKIQNFHLI